MATVITAGNATNGLSLSADNTGSFDFKTGAGAGISAMTISSSQVVSIPGNLTVVGTVTATGGVTGGLGTGQTWTDVTASRAGGTTYTNSTSKPIAWMLVCSAVNGVGILIDAAQVIPAGSVQAGYPIGCFIIQPGSTYQLTRTVSVTINKWFELR